MESWLFYCSLVKNSTSKHCVEKSKKSDCMIITCFSNRLDLEVNKTLFIWLRVYQRPLLLQLYIKKTKIKHLMCSREVSGIKSSNQLIKDIFYKSKNSVCKGFVISMKSGSLGVGFSFHKRRRRLSVSILISFSKRSATIG